MKTHTYFWPDADIHNDVTLPPGPRAAPGLTVADIDALLKTHYHEGYAQGHKDGNEAGRRRGYETGNHEGMDRVEAQIREVLNRQLNHIVRRMADYADRPKTTIAAERDRIANEVQQLQLVVRRLETVASREIQNRQEGR